MSNIYCADCGLPEWQFGTRCRENSEGIHYPHEVKAGTPAANRPHLMREDKIEHIINATIYTNEDLAASKTLTFAGYRNRITTYTDFGITEVWQAYQRELDEINRTEALN